MFDPFSWFTAHGLKIIIILIVAFLIDQYLVSFIKKAVKNKLQVANKRAETLINVFGRTLKVVIWVVVIMMILPELGVNIAPLLAGVGLVGLAVSMAARDIISDFIAGLFLLLEDQYRVGDTIKVAGVEGVVQEITLRRTILKDSGGVFHSIPNNQIKVVAKK